MWRRTTMRLELQKLNIEEGSSQSFTFDETSVVDLPGVVLVEPVTGQFVLSNLGIGYQFSGAFDARVSQPCVRCLDPVVEDVEFGFTPHSGHNPLQSSLHNGNWVTSMSRCWRTTSETSSTSDSSANTSSWSGSSSPLRRYVSLTSKSTSSTTGSRHLTQG